MICPLELNEIFLQNDWLLTYLFDNCHKSFNANFTENDLTETEHHLIFRVMTIEESIDESSNNV